MHTEQAGLAIDPMKNLAQTPGGLIVPADLAAAHAVVHKGRLAVPVARDMDGRRRLVYTNSDRKTINASMNLTETRGVTQVFLCFGQFGKPNAAGRMPDGHGYFEDGSPACGEPMRLEAAGTEDAGFGCKCTRIHFHRR